MRITGVQTFVVDGGWRPFSFIKMSTDEGLTGWAEYTESPRNRGLSAVIHNLAERIIGEDPRAFARLGAHLIAATRLSAGGINRQAVAALENACLDLAAKAANLPVYALFGGPMRRQVPVYWSHCGYFRIRHGDFFERVLGKAGARSLDDMAALGREAAERGFGALKTSPILFTPQGPRTINPGFNPNGLDLGYNAERQVVTGIADQLAALRSGFGEAGGLLLDVNFSFRPEALRRVARAIEPAGVTWLEADLADPQALATVRNASSTPIASCETLLGRMAYRPFFEAHAMDVAIVDVLWNGFAESVRIASIAECHELNVAPHNGNGPLADLMSAHYCAAVPNIQIMEIEGDDVPWKDDFLTVPRVLEGGRIAVPEGPGWGANIREDALAEHAWPAR